MRSLLVILDRAAAEIQILRGRLAHAETRDKTTRAELANLHYKFRSFANSIGLDQALGAVSDAASRAETVIHGLDALKTRVHERDALLRDVMRALSLPDDTSADRVAAAASDIAKQAHALEVVHPMLRSRTKSVAAFAEFIVTNAEDDAKLRNYLSLPARKTTD